MAQPVAAPHRTQAHKPPSRKSKEKPKAAAKKPVSSSGTRAKRDSGRAHSPQRQAKAQAITASLAPLVGPTSATAGATSAFGPAVAETAGNIWRSASHLFDGLKNTFARRQASPKTSGNSPSRENPVGPINREAVEHLRDEINSLNLPSFQKKRLAELADMTESILYYFLDKNGNDLAPETYGRINQAFIDWRKPLTPETDPRYELRERTRKMMKELNQNPDQMHKTVHMNKPTFKRFIGEGSVSGDLAKQYIPRDAAKKLAGHLDALDEKKKKDSNKV